MSEIHIGILVDERESLTLRELCEACGAPAEWVIELVEFGVLEPRGEAPSRWRFAAPAVARSQRALRLQRDLALDVRGLSLALELLDEVRDLRRRCRTLEAQLGSRETF